jgi:LysM repeat protein
MIFRVPILRAIGAFALLQFVSPMAGAQDGTAAELKSLRALIEQQSRQLDALSALVARLTARLDGGAAPAAAPASDGAEFAVPAARVVAPPAPAANVHVVVKGDSLEKIAKTHGTTTIELQRLNRISDPKKLQIGQQLVLPPTTPKKEGQ